MQKPNTLHEWNNSRLQSFFREVMEEREDTLILPSFSSSTGLACFRKFLYSSACRGVSLKQIKSSAVSACPQTNPILPPPSTQCVSFISSTRFFSYSTDSLKLPPRLMAEHKYLSPELEEEKLVDTLHSPGLCCTQPPRAHQLPGRTTSCGLSILASGGETTYCQWPQSLS